MRRRSGQTSTEYMLVISVVVIAVVAAAYTFVDPFREGVEDLGRDVSHILATGDMGGVGRGNTSMGFNGSGSQMGTGNNPGNDPATASTQ